MIAVTYILDKTFTLRAKHIKDSKHRKYMINLVGHTLKDGTLIYTFCKVCRKILLDNVERKDFRIFIRATVLSMQGFISYVKKMTFDML